MPKKNAVNAPQIVESSNAYNHPVRATSRAGSGKAANYGHIPDKTQTANFKGHIAPTGTNHPARFTSRAGSGKAANYGHILRRGRPESGNDP